MENWRVVDTGLRSAAQNIALNRVLLEARAAQAMPSTLRFLRFTPSALLGYHQSADQELNLEYCRQHGVAVQRRITGGGAIYFDEGQLGWELYLHKRDLPGADMQAVTQKICEAAAQGIRALGVQAAFRPRNDIEVEGRKISGTGGVADDDALLFQGTLLLDFDVARMLQVLKIPVEKISEKAIASARQRVTSLKELLGKAPNVEMAKQALIRAFAEGFGADFENQDLSRNELERLEAVLVEIEHPDWIGLIEHPTHERPVGEAQQKFPGGLLRASVAFDKRTERIKQTWITGDFFVNPRRTIADLEAALRDIPLDTLGPAVQGVFARREVDMLSLSPENFISVIHTAALHALALRINDVRVPCE
jgi:lipoate-protein ligase A